MYRDTTANYRIAAVGDTHQPEMRYQCKGGELWVPLLANGYWADTDAYSTGVITKHSHMTQQQAGQAIWRAQKVNRLGSKAF